MDAGVPSSWFEDAFGFSEHSSGSGRDGAPLDATLSFANVRNQFVVSGEGDDTTLTSRANGRTFTVGAFACPNIPELTAMFTADGGGECAGLSFSHVVSGVAPLLEDPRNAGAVFQVASQFNCLEMVGPCVRPEDGVTM